MHLCCQFVWFWPPQLCAHSADMVIKSQYNRVAVCTLDAEEDQCTLWRKGHFIIAPLHCFAFQVTAQAHELAGGGAGKGLLPHESANAVFYQAVVVNFSGSSQQMKKWEKNFIYWTKTWNSFCPIWSIARNPGFFSNYWLDESSKAILNETNMYNVNSFCWWHPIWSG